MSAPLEPSFITRLGLVFVHPRWALSIAGDRRAPGRAGSDLLHVIGLGLLAGYLHVLVVAVWTAVALGALEVSAATMALASGLVVPIAALVLAAAVLFAVSGKARNLGRAFDLACVAAVPLVLILFAAAAISSMAHVRGGGVVGALTLGVSFAVFGALVALALPIARMAVSVPAVPPADVSRRGQRAGKAVLGALAALVVAQAAWIATHLDDVRPVAPAGPAPAFALPHIEAKGALGARWSYAPSTHGRMVVLDFWATWCGPCLRALPHLEALRVAHPEIDVISINLDAAAAARHYFDQNRWGMRLLYDDAGVAARYGVTSLPHVVVVDRAGVVKNISRGAPRSLEELLR